MSNLEKTQKNDIGQSKSGMYQHFDSKIFRIVDAAINRAAEGLRVVEDFCRLGLDDRFLARELKELRHLLVEACAVIDSKSRLQFRDSELDVGRSIQTSSEYQRQSIESIIRSNMSRVQQATRTIEEYSKLNFPAATQTIEQVRYRSYTIEKAVFNTAFNRNRFQLARLYVLVDAQGEKSGFNKLRKLILALLDAKVDVIQLRDKTLSDRELVEAGVCIGQLTCETNTTWIMNDRADLAAASNADGVHLGQDDLMVNEARKLLAPNRIIGVSTHSIQQARNAVIDGADYIGVGPVFSSTTKSFDSFVGTELVAKVCQEISLPAFAIGGIEAKNIDQVVSAGCNRIAVSSAIANATSPGEAASSIRSRL